MLKLGITKLNQLTSEALPQHRQVSGALLLALEQREDIPRRDELRQQIIRRLVLKNKTGKTTWEGRFADLDAWLGERLLRAYPEQLRVLDIGASDGTTSLELFGTLSTHRNVTFVGSDLNRDIWVSNGPVWRDVIDDDGKLIQTTLGPLVVPITDGVHINPLLLLNRAVFYYCSTFRKDMRHRITAAEADAAGRSSAVRFSLLSPKVQDLAGRDPRFRFEKLNAFEIGGPARFEFVRAMNVLNLNKDGFGFSREQIASAAHGIREALVEGGRLLLGRSRPVGTGFEHHATLFLRSGDRLEREARYGNGSEVEDLLLSTDGAAPNKEAA